MKNQKGFSAIVLLIILGVVGSLSIGTVYLVKTKPLMFEFVSQKIKSIVTPKPSLVGSPSALGVDIKGTWVSSLRGKGFQLYGQFGDSYSSTKIYEDGDVKLVIDSIENNIAYGNISYTNLCVYGETTIPGVKSISIPQTCTTDAGTQPVKIRISGHLLDFGTSSVDGATISMQGSYTVNIMTGTMTLNSPFGVIKGEYHFTRADYLR